MLNHSFRYVIICYFFTGVRNYYVKIVNIKFY